MSNHQFLERKPISGGVTGKTRPDVLFLLHLPPPVHGSSIVGQAVRESELVNQTFNCRFINLLASRTVGDSGKLNFAKLFSFASQFFRLSRELLTRQPDLCYFALTTTGFAFFRDAILCALIKLARVPVVFHLHNKGVAGKSANRLYQRFYHFVFSNARVILLSEHLYSDVARFVPEEFVHVCSNGIPDTANNRPHSISEDANVNILFLSNLVTSKGPVDLVAACALLRDRGLKFNCTFVGAEGDISQQEFTEEINRHELGHQVQYVGPKFGQEKQEYFRAADIFAFPTYFECFPLVALEAMSYSLPIVSCPEGGIPDQVVDGVTGFLVKQRDVNLLADRLETLIRDKPLRAQMGVAGRDRYVAMFTDGAFESRFVAILQALSLSKTKS